MATTTSEAPGADTTPETVDETVDAPAPETPAAPAKRSRRGLRIGALIAGAVVVAGLLFGGGVLLGLNLPGGGPTGMQQGGFPDGGTPPEGGFGGQGGPGQQAPGTDTETDTDTESN